MDALFFIEFPKHGNIDAATKVNWYKQNNGKISTGCDELSGLKSIADKSQCIAVFPGSSVYRTQSNLAIKNRKQLAQALIYDLEEQLAEEVETLHFAYQKNAQKTLDIAIIKKNLLKNWLTALAEANIQLTYAITDTQLLDQFSEPWLILHDKGYALLKAEQNSYALDTQNLATTLASFGSDLPESISTYSTTSLVLEECPVTLATQSDQAPLFDQLCQHFTAAGMLNLLQGAFQAKTKQTWRLIQWSAAGSFILLSVLTLVQAYQNQQLQEQEAKLEQEIKAIYQSSFPKARRIINPVAQMRSGLQSLENNQIQQGGFTALLAGVARAIQAPKEISLSSIQYHQQSMLIAFSTPSLEQLEVFKNAISQQGLTAEISSATKADNRVLAQLKITEGQL
ncbi:MAG: type II secretion system protein GspL [Methyloprofundus sp.]|nr:type II secretion system protein GspL [Methyloprofundus sp.]